jgi:hypothetical protein
MIEPRPSVARFVRAVVRNELSGGGGTERADVAVRITLRLHKELGNLIGPAGVDVLLARSVVLARRAHPILAGVTAGPRGTLAGLDDTALPGVELQEGAVAIVAHFIELLVTLIGEDLAMALVGAVWPAAAEAER